MNGGISNGFRALGNTFNSGHLSTSKKEWTPTQVRAFAQRFKDNPKAAVDYMLGKIAQYSGPTDSQRQSVVIKNFMALTKDTPSIKNHLFTLSPTEGSPSKKGYDLLLSSPEGFRGCLTQLTSPIHRPIYGTPDMELPIFQILRLVLKETCTPLTSLNSWQ